MSFIINLNFHTLDAVARYRDPQHQVSENYSHVNVTIKMILKVMPV